MIGNIEIMETVNLHQKLIDIINGYHKKQKEYYLQIMYAPIPSEEITNQKIAIADIIKDDRNLYKIIQTYVYIAKNNEVLLF